MHIQKYDGFENIEIRSRALGVTLGSSTDTNLGHNQTKNFKKRVGQILVFSNRIFSGSSWPLIICRIVFRISATKVTQNRRQN